MGNVLFTRKIWNTVLQIPQSNFSLCIVLVNESYSEIDELRFQTSNTDLQNVFMFHNRSLLRDNFETCKFYRRRATLGRWTFDTRFKFTFNICLFVQWNGCYFNAFIFKACYNTLLSQTINFSHENKNRDFTNKMLQWRNTNVMMLRKIETMQKKM